MCVAEELRIILGYFFFSLLVKTYIVCTHLKHLCEMLWMSTHNIGFYGELEKIIPELSSITLLDKPASVAQLDARPTGDQEVTGSTPARLVTFFRRDWSWNIFYGLSLPSADSGRAVVNF